MGYFGIDMDKKIVKEVDGVDIVVGGYINIFFYIGNSCIRIKYLEL